MIAPSEAISSPRNCGKRASRRLGRARASSGSALGCCRTTPSDFDHPTMSDLTCWNWNPRTVDRKFGTLDVARCRVCRLTEAIDISIDLGLMNPTHPRRPSDLHDPADPTQLPPATAATLLDRLPSACSQLRRPGHGGHVELSRAYRRWPYGAGVLSAARATLDLVQSRTGVFGQGLPHVDDSCIGRIDTGTVGWKGESRWTHDRRRAEVSPPTVGSDWRRAAFADTCRFEVRGLT